jgi:acyl-CoA thioesterase-1
MVCLRMICSRVSVFLMILTGITIASTSLASAQIVALGHSAVQDPFVFEKEMWPAVLEGMLRARGSQVHVINAGVAGETTTGTLSRVSGAVPDGTKIVILMDEGSNDGRKCNCDTAANIAAIHNQLKARGIKVIDAMGIYVSVMKQPGMKVVDGKHLSVEGNKKVASILAGMVR